MDSFFCKGRCNKKKGEGQQAVINLLYYNSIFSAQLSYRPTFI